MQVETIFPIWADLRRYRHEWLAHDLLAGLERPDTGHVNKHMSGACFLPNSTTRFTSTGRYCHHRYMMPTDLMLASR
jgi:hypothetical protein